MISLKISLKRVLSLKRLRRFWLKVLWSGIFCIQDKEHRGEPFETLNIWNAIVTEQLKELLNRACEVQRVAGAWAALIAGPTVMSAIDIVYETEVDEFDNEELYTQGAYFILRAIMKMHGTEI